MMNLNNYLKTQIDSNNCAFLPKNVKDSVISDFEVMSHLGIDNDDDQYKFFLLLNNIPEILHLIFKIRLNEKIQRVLVAEVFKNRKNIPIDTLLGLIEAIGLALHKMIPQNIKSKLAYPQVKDKEQLPQYNISHWVEVTKKIYELMSKGYSSEQAKESVIGNWERREKMDYENWLRFYKEKVPEKYPKLAFDMSEPMLGGLPVNSLKAIMPTQNGQGYAVKVPPGLPQHLPNDINEARDTIESQRKKLIGRLNSAEKLLSSMDGQLFAGDDQELMLKLLQDLKRRILTANKRTIKSSLFEDHIYRTANLLKVQGKDNAANFFIKMAQFGDLGAPVGLPGVNQPEQALEAPSSGDGNETETHDLLKEFFDNLKRGVDDSDDTVEERKENAQNPKVPEPAQTPTTVQTSPVMPPPLSVSPPPPTATALIDLSNQIKIGMGYWNPTLKIAQIAPNVSNPVIPNKSIAPISNKPRMSNPLETPKKEEGIIDDNTDDVIDAALKNVNINDAVRRLEMLVSIYNKRELSRQLGILDIMLDRLGIAAYFPSLGEAMSKALEANQYIGNRLGEILSRIKGSVDSPGASEWVESNKNDNPETEGLRNRLEQDKIKEDQRKELRKQQDLAKSQGIEPPTANPLPTVGESADLQKPSRVEKAPKLEVR